MSLENRHKTNSKMDTDLDQGIQDTWRPLMGGILWLRGEGGLWRERRPPLPAAQ